MRNKWLFLLGLLALAGAIVLGACQQAKPTPTPPAVALPSTVEQVAKARGLSPDDLLAAAKTYTPTGKMDEYVMFSSGGHSGQVLVIGIPSMRILKVIGVFTPEPWQGYATGDEGTGKVLAGGDLPGQPIRWGDTHHPALSETNGDYDGQFLFIGDKANARLAVIDLQDFETKQVVKNPLIMSSHGAAFVTPNTDYIIETSQYAVPLGWEYAPIDQYQAKYRGVVTFWRFDRQKGRINPEQSFSIELPPYWQDLCDAGKLASDGWAFCNSFNSEMATGGVEEGKPPFESGASQRDRDYLHIINWKKAEEVVRAGKAETINGMKVIRLSTAANEGVLFFAPEPKSPHGVDVAPKGDYIVVSGKLDPHVTVYSIEKIKGAIAKGVAERDPYGVPILKFEDVVEAQVELGLGPLHTQFDNQGYAYTSLFLDSAVARWSLGPPYRTDGWKLVEKIPVHYNIGHLAALEGDTVSPDGQFVVALNKWSVDRFLPVGPLHPQNFQLIDISSNPAKLLYDLPIPVAEPHYAQIIKADKLKAWTVYPDIGWDPITQAKDPQAPVAGKERVVRDGNTVHIYMTAVRSHFTPERVRVKKGERVVWHITNIERTRDASHGLAIGGYNKQVAIDPGETAKVEFVADRPGVFPFYCTEFCSALHLEMTGYLLVEP
ncbi:MAG: Sec-dependent nitrous-oxide reductase [Dehalococcoidia bacterium]